MMEKRITINGVRLTPVSRAIIAHLQQHGRQTFDQLHEHFREPTTFRCNHHSTHIPNPQWLRSRLVYLRGAGYISRELDDGTLYYVAGSQADDVDPATKVAAPTGNVTPPRRVEVMNAPAYCPPRAAPYRAGAMDFAACPSVHAGRSLPFTGKKEVLHG